MKKRIISLLLAALLIVSLLPVTAAATDYTQYYLVGNINGSASGCEEDYEAFHEEYQFDANGQLEVMFTEPSAVFVKTSGNAHWYLAANYVTPAQSASVTLAKENAEKVSVNANVPICFTLAENDDGTVNLSYEEAHTHGTGDDAITFEAWMDSTKLPNTADLTDSVGSFYLTEDVTLSNTWEVPTGTTNLCLNGHVINMTGNSGVIKIPSGATLNLYDCGTTEHYFTVGNDGLWTLSNTETDDTKTVVGGVITGGYSSTGGGVFVSDGGKFTMNGGTIAGCQALGNVDASQGGGGVFVDKKNGNGGIFTMNSGTIKGCIATSNGGGVFNKGTFTMYAGSIQECKTLSTSTKGLGGGVCNFDNATFTLSGGTIQNNTASRYGGGVSNTGDGTVNITSGSIINNTAENNNNGGGGGGINSDGNVTITGGIIANNTAAKDGGGVRFNGDNKILTINGGTIEKNDAVGAGGVWSKGTVIMTGGAIKNNTSDGWGGGVQVAGGSFEMTDGNITGNAVDNGGDGGGVYIGGGGTFTMNRGSITQNSLGTDGWGGGVFIDDGNFTVTDGSIAKNEAVKGGGVGIYKGTFNATNSAISANTASYGGGAVYADTKSDSALSVTTMTNCQICDNESKWGGGIFINKGNVTATNCQITGNTALSGGGAVEIENDESTFIMNGGSINENSVTEVNDGLHKGAGVHFNKGTFAIKGEVNITNNKCAGVDSNVYLRKHSVTFNIAEMDTESSIGVFAAGAEDGSATTVKLADGSSGLSCFTSDNTAFAVKLNNGTEQAGDEYLELVQGYAITNDAPESGKDTAKGYLTVDKKSTYVGGTVTVTVVPNSGYRLKANTLKATYDDNGEVEGGEKSCELAGTGNTYTFDMPAYVVIVSAEFEQIPTPSSGGNSSSTITVPVSGDANSVKISATVSGSTATVKPIKDADLAKVADGESVAIDLSGAGKNVDTAKIPTETVEKISEKSALTVKLPVATVEFDNAATAEIADQAKGNNIELVVDSVKEVSLNAVQKESVKKLDTALIIDAHLVSNGERLCSADNGGFGGGGKATVILPYEIKNNRTAANYSVYYVNDAGKLQKLAAKYDEELAAFVFEIEHFSVYAVAYDENACEQDATCVYAKFTDADTKAWYHDGVHFCVKNGYMQGVSADKFAPNGTLSRAMIVTMLWRMEGEPIVNCAMTFKDVKADQWYTEAIRWAQSNKIVEGYSADSFGPDDDVTREQLAAILYRYAQAKGEGFTGSWMFLLDLVDRADISSWADEAVHWCSMKGIVNGKDGKVFDPQGKATRAEAAAMIQRFCENILSK